MLASRCSCWVGKKDKQNTKIKGDKERPYLIDYKVEREPKSKGLKLGTVGVVRKAFREDGSRRKEGERRKEHPRQSHVWYDLIFFISQNLVLAFPAQFFPTATNHSTHATMIKV